MSEDLDPLQTLALRERAFRGGHQPGLRDVKGDVEEHRTQVAVMVGGLGIGRHGIVPILSVFDCSASRDGKRRRPPALPLLDRNLEGSSPVLGT